MLPELEDGCEDCGVPAGAFCRDDCRGPAYTAESARRLAEIRVNATRAPITRASDARTTALATLHAQAMMRLWRG